MDASQTSRIEEWVKTCNTECLQRTVGEGNADVFVRVDGTSALHLAAALPQQADAITVATVLLSSGANPNIPNKEGKTSMHVAAFMGYTDLLQLLLLNGGDPLLGDLRGCSPVDSAFQGNHQDTLKFLNHLLDTEEYSSEKNLQFTLSFMRVMVVELPSVGPASMTQSLSSFYSCNSSIQNCDGAKTSLGTYIANLNKPHCDHPQSEEACIHCEPPPWLSSNTFLGSLKRQVEVFQGDTSDSEHDLRTLHSYLGWTLRQDEHWCQNTDSEIESTFRELNNARLNVNMSSDISVCLLENNEKVNGYQSFEEDSLCTESFGHESSTFDSRENISSSGNSSATLYETEFSSHFSENERSELWLGHFDGDETPTLNYKPEFCTSMHLIKCPKKREMFTHKVYEATPSLRKELHLCFDNTASSTSSIDTALEKGLSYQDGIRRAPSPPSPLRPAGTQTAQSLASSCPSLLSIAEEFLYKDKETGIQLIERRCPAVAVLSRSNGTSHGASNRGASGHVEVLEERASEKSFDSIGPLTDTIKAMSVEVLRDNLNKLGFEPGPILPSTHTVYMRQLVRLRRTPGSSPEKQSSPPQYCKEVRLVLRQPHAIPWDAWTALEEEMSRPFSQPDHTRHWRDGVNKSCFNYLLLDPRITQNLPLMGSAMDEREKIACFVASIFYVGKGSRNRPYYHLYEAMNKQSSKPQNKKIQKIQDIWADDLGVVSLHVFQNTIPVEAWTREAAMIAALGLKNVCNNIQGTFYGPSSTWANPKRHKLGTSLLCRSFNIFLQEGERQLRPCDIAAPSRPT